VLWYVGRRVGLALGVLWAAFTVSFVVLWLLPGDPVEVMASGGLDGEPLTPQQLAELRARYGFDKPLLVQYGDRLWAALHGDFGASIQSGLGVRTQITDALPPTLRIALGGLMCAAVFGGSLALVATYTRVRWLRRF
jgi:peptide/nickel transport system permease protein